MVRSPDLQEAVESLLAVSPVQYHAGVSGWWIKVSHECESNALPKLPLPTKIGLCDLGCRAGVPCARLPSPQTPRSTTASGWGRESYGLGRFPETPEDEGKEQGRRQGHTSVKLQRLQQSGGSFRTTLTKACRYAAFQEGVPVFRISCFASEGWKKGEGRLIFQVNASVFPPDPNFKLNVAFSSREVRRKKGSLALLPLPLLWLLL